MNSAERVAAAIALKEPDRVPVSPFLIYHLATITNTSMKDFVWDVDACHDAARRALDYYDGLLDTMNLTPMRFAFTATAPILYSALYYDWRFFDDEMPQVLEFTQAGPEIYDDVLRAGFAAMRTHKRIGRWEVFKSMSVHLSRHLRRMKEWRQNCDVVPWQEFISYLPAELMLFYRGMDGLTDLIDRPEKIIEVNEKHNKTIIKTALHFARLLGSKSICIPSLKFSSSMVSPKMFEKFAWPWLKEQVLAYSEAGYLVILHLDGDWNPLLEYFTELPAGSAVIELDISDMLRAKQVLGDTLCIKGNIDPTLLAFGAPDEVETECKRLIDGCAAGGGFILSSGCEAPPNSKPENIRAMLRCAVEYGKY
jgi:uroporphyrinogen-III decarboxylase